MDSVASNTSNEEATHVSPQYDSSEEWEIGLGNLIIDLDADLEKDRQDGSGAAGSGGNSNSAAGSSATPVDSSPLRIGKMKIKRKVSTNTPTTPSKGSDSASPRKDNLLSTEEDCSGSTGEVPTGHKSPVPQTERIVMVMKDEKLEKVTKCSMRNSGGNTTGSSGTNSTPHHNKDSNSSTSSACKHLDKVLISTNTKGSISLTSSGDISSHHGTYNLSEDKKDLSMDNNICRNKASMDHKPQIVIKKETTGGAKKKEEKEGKGETSATGKKGADCSSKRHGGKKRTEKTSSNSIAVGTSDVGTLTEPENLGPCEPGTSVNLEGIVWHETDQGVLVVNVTWRNKTYVGTLMDCTRHDWAPPRFCDSPTSDVENRTTKTCGRPKRGRANNNTNSNDMSNFTETRSSVHSKLRNATALKGRKGNSANGSRSPPGTVEKPAEKPEKGKRKHRTAETGASSGDDSTKSAKRLKISTKPNAPTEVVPEPGPSGLIECSEPNCNKKYKHVNGLRYHQQHAHQDDKQEDDEEEEEEEEQDSENKSSSDEGSVASAEIDNHINEKSKSEWNDSSRTNGASTTNETKATASTPAITQHVDPIVDKRQLYSTAAAAAAANAAAAAAAAASAAELLKVDAVSDAVSAKPLKGGHKSSASSSSDKTSPKLLAKSKDTVGMPVKSKGDLSDKTGGKSKKMHNSTDKDLSVFDFNSAIDSDGMTGSADKHVSVIRPTADASVSSPLKSSEPIAPVMAPAKLQDVIHTMPLPGSEHMEDLQKPSKKSDKDKTKSGDRKKGKHDKVPNSKVKPTRPVTSSPIPPQLVAVPASVATTKGSATGTTQPPKAPLANTKQPVNPAMKPMQPKPNVSGEASPPVTNPKEKKSKSKKKSKDKDKEREKTSNCTKDKESKDSSVTNNKQQSVQQQPPPAVQPVKQSVAPTLPPAIAKPQTQLPAGTINSALTETNILHQALTASGIGPEDAERNSPSVTANSGEVLTKVADPSQVATKEQQAKDARPLFPNRPPVQHGSMPEMPKLIPTSSVINPGGRASVNAMDQPQLPTHQVKPIQSMVVQDNSKVDKPSVPVPPQIKATLLADSESNVESEESRARSPAYSDISDANEDSEMPAKTLNDRDPFNFQDASRNQAKVGPRDEHIHSKSLFNPLLDVGREHLPDGMHKTQQDPLRTVPPLVQPVKAGTGKEGSQTEGPDAKKPRKDTGSPRLPGPGEAGYRPPSSQAYPGQYPFTSGFVMDQQYHMHLLNTDPRYRQQHEQFRQEQKQLQEKERLERERHERSSKEKAPSTKMQDENRERTMPMIKTEPITPPKRHVLGEKGQDRGATERPPTGDNLLKRKQLDFHKPGSDSTTSSENSSERSASQQEESPRHGAKSYIHQQHQEEMRQYYIYQKKVQEQQKYEEEQRRKLEESRLSAETSGSQKEAEATGEETGDRHRPTSSPSPQRPNPPKSRSPAPSSVEDRKLRQSPSTSSPSPHSRDPKAAMASSSSSRKVLDYPSYLQHTPYGPMPMHQTPYGPIPIDPNHPAYHHAVNPLVAYPAFLGHEMRYAGPMVSPAWKSSDEKGHFEHERSRAISPHQSSTSRGSSPSDPPKALDLLQQHASRYYQKHDRARSPGDKSRTSSPQRRPSSPRKSPEASSSSRERMEAIRAEQMQQAMIHQHMHTHQHTHHVGMGYPPVMPPYDPYVMASQQAAAAAAGVGPPYAVRRENIPP